MQPKEAGFICFKLLFFKLFSVLLGLTRIEFLVF